MLFKNVYQKIWDKWQVLLIISVLIILNTVFLSVNCFPESCMKIKITQIESRDLYKVKLIKLFLNKAGVEYQILPSKYFMTKPREFEEIKKGNLINVGIFTSSVKYESSLIPIRFPIYKGLIGYRIFIINKDKQKIFDDINSIDQLKKLVCVQGLSWTDSDILESLGFKVERIRYENIFAMINADHGIDFFPRGIYEVFFEMDNHKKFPNITIEKHIMLHYPLAMFLYISPKAPKIAKTLKKGFKIALRDGSLEKLQKGKIIGDYTIVRIIQLANFKKRKIFELPNPFLTEKTKNLPERYWYKFQ